MKLAQWLKSRAFRTQKTRRMKRWERRPRLVERLEDRSLLATLYVNDNWDMVVDVGPAGLSAGDTVNNQSDVTAGAPTLYTKQFGTEAFSTIQAGVDAAVDTDTVTVLRGTYTENVSVAKNITLNSDEGRAQTTIAGISPGSGLGTVLIDNTVATTGLVIGGVGQGFTIVGIDNVLPGIESAAIYIRGTHSGTQILDNEVRANGDSGLTAEFGAPLSNFVISGNTFSGQTFAGAAPAGDGTGAQFTLPNVPRQLVVMGSGGGAGASSVTGLTFTNNILNGTAGGISTTDNSGNPVAAHEQGNSLATLDVSSSTISGNMFAGTTNRFGAALRVRRPNTIISGNDFSSAGMGAGTTHITVQNNTTPLENIVAANTFDRGSYVNGGSDVSVSIAGGIGRAVAGNTLNVLPGTYNESPNINKSLVVQSTGGRDVTTINLQTGPTYLGSLTISGAGNNVTVQGFTINGRDGTPTTLAASNIYLEADLGDVVISDNRIRVGAIDAASSNGDDGFGILTTYSETSDVDSLTVSGNIIETLNGTGGRAFYVNPGVDAFTFSDNIVNGNFTRTAITQAKDGLVEDNFVAGSGSSAGLGAWGFPNATVYGHTTFRANTIVATGTAITIFEANDVIVEENFLNSNGTGVRVQDFLGGVSFDPTTIRIFNNDLSNNTAFAVNNTTSALVNASGNWYGTVDPAAVAAEVSVNVDYTPWLGSDSDTSGNAGFQGDFSQLYVDDDSPQSGTAGRIQEGIDLATTDGFVFAAAGTYVEQLTITKSVNVIGSVDGLDAPTTILTFNAPGGGNLVSIQGAAFMGSRAVSFNNFAFQGKGANNIDNGVFVNSNARLLAVAIVNSTFEDFDINGVAVFGDTANGGLSVENVALGDVQFTDNGYQNIGGAGDINLFNYNGGVGLEDLTLTNASTGARGSIQMRGVGSNTTTGADLLPIGEVSLNGVDVSGVYRNYMITFQRYSDAAGLSLNDVALGGAGSALSGTFGAALRFDAVGTGTPASPDTVDLGNTYFRGLATYSPVFDIEFAPDNTFAFLRADGTDTRWNTTTGGGVNVAAAGLTLAQAFEVEDRILHYVEPDHPTHLKPFKGWVEVVDGNAYITATFNSVIQRGIEMVDAGGTVNVKSGSYTGNVDATASGVNKAITLAAGSSPGQVTINGNLALDANDTLAIEIEGTNAASAFDNFIVTGSISLGGSTLDLSGSYVPVNGDSFTILDGSAGLSGMFAGLDDGDTVTLNGKTLQIRYLAATSDVVLTAVEAPTITSAASATFAVAVSSSFTVTTTGFPTASISASGTLPSGVVFVDQGNGTAVFAGTPAVGSDGVYSIVITASNGVSPDAVQNFTLIVTPLAAGNAFILPDPCDPSQMALVITGTSGNDKIEVKRKNHTQVQVTINKKKITLQAAAFERIYAYGGNGNDSISVQHLVNKEAFLFGENGRDVLRAGGARSVLVGGTGDDSLTGSQRRDVLIGGTGKDAITGLGGDDIMIAGTTDHDANEMALCDILDEWTSGDDYSTRRARLSGTDALPGLLHVSKVQDDGAKDKLEKTKQLDWYFANVVGGGVKDTVVRPNFSLITDI